MMKIPIGLTYVAHAIIALVLLTVGAVTLSMKLGTSDFGSGQALGTLLGLGAAIPCAISLLVAAYSGITVVVTLVRRQRPPRDMMLLPAGLLISVAAGEILADLENPLWNFMAYVPIAIYGVVALALGVRYRFRRLGPAKA